MDVGLSDVEDSCIVLGKISVTEAVVPDGLHLLRGSG